jgi:hypothetical protein
MHVMDSPINAPLFFGARCKSAVQRCNFYFWQLRRLASEPITEVYKFPVPLPWHMRIPQYFVLPLFALGTAILVRNPQPRY